MGLVLMMVAMLIDPVVERAGGTAAALVAIDDVVGEEPEIRMAPPWPFYGFVTGALSYWDDSQETFHLLEIGGTDDCPTPPVADDRGTQISGSGGSSIYFAPWGDYAYPLFTELLAPLDSEEVKPIDISVAGVPVRDAGYPSWAVDVSIGSKSQWYMLSSGRFDEVDIGQVDVDESLREWYDDYSAVFFAGHDGRNYGLQYRDPEGACPWNIAYVIDGNSGTLIACGQVTGGIAFIRSNGSNDEPSSYQLPRTSERNCSDGIRNGIDFESIKARREIA
ncbi:hypothetical protein [Candidatus Poriferisodalis sp.]|uniref:hypothetical protein n=1 Tax=Candidatus Poriferisodalis sp. TaxID=3101277 RepID=UPI003B51E0F8